MTAFDDEAVLAAYVGDETAWAQFVEAHTSERLDIMGELARVRGAHVRLQDGVWVLSTDAGRVLGEYPTADAAQQELRPGGKWWWVK